MAKEAGISSKAAKKKAGRLQQQQQAAAAAASAAGASDSSTINNAELAESMSPEEADAMRDQGFCRPRVLILCPFRGTALKVVESIRGILGENTSISGWDKLEEEFSAPDSDDSETAANLNKPEDWKKLFDQNIDDDFKVPFIE